jgi:hypothetical protein
MFRMLAVSYKDRNCRKYRRSRSFRRYTVHKIKYQLDNNY